MLFFKQAFPWKLPSAYHVLPPEISMVHHLSPSSVRCHLPSGGTLFILLKLPPTSWHSQHSFPLQDLSPSDTVADVFICFAYCLSSPTRLQTLPTQGFYFGLLFSAVSLVPRRALVTWLGVQDLLLSEYVVVCSEGIHRSSVSRVVSPSLSLRSFWSAETWIVTGSAAVGSVTPSCPLLSVGDHSLLIIQEKTAELWFACAAIFLKWINVDYSRGVNLTKSLTSVLCKSSAFR